MKVTIQESVLGHKFVELAVGPYSGPHVRVFSRRWPHWKPFAFRLGALIAFGVGPVGVNLWPRVRNRGGGGDE